MPRIVRAGLIQATLCEPATSPTAKIKQAMIDKHVALIAEAAGKGVQVLCLQELFYGPYFCAEQKARWYELVEKIPDGPTTRLFCEIAKKHQTVIVLPIYEEELTGVYYNTAAVIDADGTYLGKFRKLHIPHCDPGFWEKFYFRPGNLGYSPRGLEKWACTSATTATFPKGGAPSDWRARKSCLIPRRRSRVYRNICGSSSSPPRRPTTFIMWGRSIALGSRSLGASASSTEVLISRTLAARSSRRGLARRTASSSPIWISI